MLIELTRLTQKQKQKYFNQVVDGLASQSFERCQINGYCRLRDGTGKKCALGWLIPDELYSHSLEGMYLQDWLKQLNITTCYLTNSDLDFFNDLRAAHDQAYTPHFMTTQLRHVAILHELSIPPEIAK